MLGFVGRSGTGFFQPLDENANGTDERANVRGGIFNAGDSNSAREIQIICGDTQSAEKIMAGMLKLGFIARLKIICLMMMNILRILRQRIKLLLHW